MAVRNQDASLGECMHRPACSHSQFRGSRLKTAWCAPGSWPEPPQWQLQSVPGLWLQPLLPWPCYLTRRQPLSHTRRSQGSHKAPQSRGCLPPPQEECELPRTAVATLQALIPPLDKAATTVMPRRSCVPSGLRLQPSESGPTLAWAVTTTMQGRNQASSSLWLQPLRPQCGRGPHFTRGARLTLGFGPSPPVPALLPTSHKWPPGDAVHAVCKSSSLNKGPGHKLHKMGTCLNITKLI